MKSPLAWIYVTCVASLVACTFDRSPIKRSDAESAEPPALAKVQWSSDLKPGPRDMAGVRTGIGDSSSNPDKKTDAGQGSEARRSTTAGKGSSDGSKVSRQPSDADGGPEGSKTGEQSEPAPMPIRCKDTFCPLASQPVKACCTTEQDTERHGARAAQTCGVDLSALDETLYGKGCWQRDQLGIIDPRCPDHGNEPGCCADDGYCGSSNGDQRLGCYHAMGLLGAMTRVIAGCPAPPARDSARRGA